MVQSLWVHSAFGSYYQGSRRRQWHPLQYSCLESSMDGGAPWAAVHGVAKSWTRLSDFTFTFHFHALEKEMATHYSVLAWRIPRTGEPGGLPSLGLHRVGHDWWNLAAAVAAATRVHICPTANGQSPHIFAWSRSHWWWPGPTLSVHVLSSKYWGINTPLGVGLTSGMYKYPVPPLPQGR